MRSWHGALHICCNSHVTCQQWLTTSTARQVPAGWEVANRQKSGPGLHALRPASRWHVDSIGQAGASAPVGKQNASQRRTPVEVLAEQYVGDSEIGDSNIVPYLVGSLL